jgi:glycerol kinase
LHLVGCPQQILHRGILFLKPDGGATANRWMMQFQADILSTPDEVPETLETTALGAAYLSGLAVGFWQDREELENRWRFRRRYEPQMSEEERERLYGRWKEAVERSMRQEHHAASHPRSRREATS